MQTKLEMFGFKTSIIHQDHRLVDSVLNLLKYRPSELLLNRNMTILELQQTIIEYKAQLNRNQPLKTWQRIFLDKLLQRKDNQKIE